MFTAARITLKVYSIYQNSLTWRLLKDDASQLHISCTNCVLETSAFLRPLGGVLEQLDNITIHVANITRSGKDAVRFNISLML